jgi:ABC-type nickel/cobalt efflux system permease component RcnA
LPCALQGGKYQLIDLVAEGGMASVWSAHMRTLDTEVAVKVLSPALANLGAFRAQFRAEAHRIAQLHHPNIIEIHDCEAEDDLLYIAMRLLRRAQGFALAIVGLFICAAMLLGLPLWESGAIAAGLQWVVRLAVGLAIFGLLIGLRGRARQAVRVLLVPALDRQISAFYAPPNEDAAEARLHLLGLVSDGLIDLLYVVRAFVALVLPLVGALSASSDLSWLTTVVYVAFIAIAGWLLYRVWRHADAAGLGTVQPETAVATA